jgi:hypothetical protein
VSNHGFNPQKTVKSTQMISGIKVRIRTSGKLYKKQYNIFIGDFGRFVKEKGGKHWIADFRLEIRDSFGCAMYHSVHGFA